MEITIRGESFNTYGYITIPFFLIGDLNFASATNSAIFLTVREFIVCTNRFGVVNRVATES